MYMYQKTTRETTRGDVTRIMYNNFARFGTPIIEDDDISLKVSPSVACLISYIGDKQFFICSGFIMECECLNDDAFVATLLTSATLLRPNKYRHKEIASGIKIEVIIIDGEVLEGRILGFDLHYNVAAIQVISSTPLSTVVVRPITIAEEDAVEKGKSFQFALHPCTSASPFPISPGEPVFALGRHFMDPFDIMAAPGEFCSEKCVNWTMCRELLKSSCNIKKNGIGGPLINRDGQVIGINFYMEKYTPFLPINIAIKCFEHFKKNGCVPQPWPWLGLRGFGLNLMGSVREKIKRRFPFVSRGLIIENVDSRSPAEDAGLFPGDVVIRCGENDVGNMLEVSEIMWDKLGKYVELVVVRAWPYKQRKMVHFPPYPPKTYTEIVAISVGPIITFDDTKNWHENYWVVPSQYSRLRGAPFPMPKERIKVQLL